MLVNNEIDFLIHCIYQWLYYESRQDMLRKNGDISPEQLQIERKQSIDGLINKLEDMKNEN